MSNATFEESRRIFISDCEGPISKNDNAYELTEHFVPGGDKFFALISKYDDVQADIVRRSGYKAGDTLRLILPFLKAQGVTNEKIRKFSAANISLVPGAKDTLHFVKSTMPSFIVSTSYEQYMRAVCDSVDFPFSDVYCTELNIDKYRIEEKEIEKLKQIRKEIVSMPMIETPDNASSLDDFSATDQRTIRRLDEIFWEEISEMESGRMLEDVNPVGGFEKASAVEDIVKKAKSSLRNVVYFGDSITDVQCFQLVKQNGGLAISFNGNSYAVREAEIAILSDNTIAASILADVFNRLGKDGVLQLVKEWSYVAPPKYCAPPLRKQLVKLYPKNLPQVEIITSNNRKRLMRESTAFRKSVRGQVIGKLG